MTQAERDRLVTLKKAKKKLITQQQAAAELGCTTRQVRRMLKRLQEEGDRSVIGGNARVANQHCTNVSPITLVAQCLFATRKHVKTAVS